MEATPFFLAHGGLTLFLSHGGLNHSSFHIEASLFFLSHGRLNRSSFHMDVSPFFLSRRPLSFSLSLGCLNYSFLTQ
jgi:hypothetical protein